MSDTQKDIDATTLNSFKSRLERKRNQEMDFFKDNSLPSPIGCTTLYQYEDCV